MAKITYNLKSLPHSEEFSHERTIFRHVSSVINEEFGPNADLPGINHEHRPVVTLSVVVRRKGELARQQFLFFVIKMAFQFYALPDRIVVKSQMQSPRQAFTTVLTSS